MVFFIVADLIFYAGFLALLRAHHYRFVREENPTIFLISAEHVDKRSAPEKRASEIRVILEFLISGIAVFVGLLMAMPISTVIHKGAFIHAAIYVSTAISYFALTYSGFTARHTEEN